MKKHLQFNDITALSLGWRAARRKAEKERRAEREKEQSSSSLLCIFIKENITSFPSCSLFLFSSFGFFVSLIYIPPPLLPLCPPFSLTFSYTATDSFSFSLHCASWFIYSGHSVLPYEKLFIPQCIFFLCGAVTAIASQSTGLLEGLERFISKHYKSALLPSVPAPSSADTWHFSAHPS